MTIRIAIELTIEIPAPSTAENVAKDLEDIDKVKTKSGIEIPVQNSTVIQGGQLVTSYSSSAVSHAYTNLSIALIYNQ